MHDRVRIGEMADGVQQPASFDDPSGQQFLAPPNAADGGTMQFETSRPVPAAPGKLEGRKPEIRCTEE